MPHVAGITCPKCDTALEVDAQMELWPLPKETKQALTNEYFKVKLLPIICPECTKDLIYQADTKKTYFYDKVIAKLNPTSKKFVEMIKQFIKHMRIEYSLFDNHLTFKDFSETLDILEETDNTINK